MELMQIRYFLEVASSQHITHSAEKLHIAQPALTQAINRLEADLGVPLFMSKGRNIVLTEYGRYLQQAVTPLIMQLDMIPDSLRRMAKLDSETIRINVRAASAIVTEAIIAYKNKHDNIHFSLFQSPSSEICDIEVTTKMFYHVSHGQNCEFAINEKIFLAVSESKFGSCDSVTIKDIADEGFICLLGSRQFRAICDKHCHHAGFKPKIIFESDNPTAVRNMIAANMGVGFWPEFTWGRTADEHVKLMEISDMPCSRDIVISYNPTKVDNSNVVDFYEFLRDFCINRRNEIKATQIAKK
ncbi:MAG: LysR family transcriptional regulator [Clostridiales bacterium]|nr:LysR family transcriptional regulator [Clostridiales bacterium]